MKHILPLITLGLALLVGPLLMAQTNVAPLCGLGNRLHHQRLFTTTTMSVMRLPSGGGFIALQHLEQPVV